MKEFTLHATLAEPMGACTPQEVSALLAALLRKQGMIVSARQNEDTEVWVEDKLQPADRRLKQYCRVCFNPFFNTKGDLYINARLLTSALVYTGAPLGQLCNLETPPARVIADGQVTDYNALQPAQWRRMNDIYVVVDRKVATSLECNHRPRQSQGRMRNRYTEAREVLEPLLRRCFATRMEEEDGKLSVSATPMDIPEERTGIVSTTHRLLLFGEGHQGYNPNEDFPAHGSYQPAPQNSLKFIMFYPKGEKEAAIRLYNLFFPLTGLLAMMPIKDERNWVEYDVDDHPLEHINHALLSLKQKNGDSRQLLICYITPTGRAAAIAERLHLSVHFRSSCVFYGFHYLQPIPRKAIEHPAFKSQLPGMASSILVSMGGLTWKPHDFTTQDSDLIISLSRSRSLQGKGCLCGGTFYFNLRTLFGSDFVFEERMFWAGLYSAFRGSIELYKKDHDGNPPRRVVIYCYRNLSPEQVKLFSRLLKQNGEKTPVVLAFVNQCTDAYPTAFDPSHPSNMPADGTFIDLGEGHFQLFCNDLHPDSERPVRRYPLPLDIHLARLMEDQVLLPLPWEEAKILLTQAYQLTCMNPSRLNRCLLPVVMSHADQLARDAYAEELAAEALAAATESTNGDVAMWRNDEMNMNN